jgi:WD40 repeat protein
MFANFNLIKLVFHQFQLLMRLKHTNDIKNNIILGAILTLHRLIAPKFTLTGHTKSITTLTALRNGDILSGSINSLRVWKADHMYNLIGTFKHHVINCLLTLPNGMFAMAMDNIIDICEYTGLIHSKYKIKEHFSVIRCMVYLPNGHLASGANDLTIRVFDSNDKYKRVKVLNNDAWVTCLAHTTEHLVSGTISGKIMFYSVYDDYNCINTIESKVNVTSLLVLDDNRLACGFYDGVINIWDYRGNKCLATMNDHKVWVSAMVSVDGFIVSVSRDGTIRIWSCLGDRCIKMIQAHGDCIKSIIKLLMIKRS